MSTGVLTTIAGTTATYVANGKVQYNLSGLAGQASFGKKIGYVRRAIIEAQPLRLDNSNAAARTIEWQKLYDFLQGVKFHTPEHDFVDCPNSGGMSLMVSAFTQGRVPEIGPQTPTASLQIAGTNNLSLYPKVAIQCFRQRHKEPEDDMIPVEMLKDSTLELKWAASGWAGADVSINAISTFVVSFELVPRNERRLCGLWKLTEFDPQSLETQMTPNRVVYTDAFIMGINAAGLTARVFTAANFTAINLRMDGTPVNDNIAPQTLIAKYNDQVPNASESLLPTLEAGTNWLIPLFYVEPSSGKKTKLAMAVGNPNLKITGSITVSNIRVLQRFIVPSGKELYNKVASRIGWPLDGQGGAVANKGLSKQPVEDAVGQLVLPQKFYPGKGGKAAAAK